MAALERLRVERRVAVAGGLGNAERGRPRRSVDAPGLVAVCEGAAPLGTLVAPGAYEALALDLHDHAVGRREGREHAFRPILNQVFHAMMLSVHVCSP